MSWRQILYMGLISGVGMALILSLPEPWETAIAVGATVSFGLYIWDRAGRFKK